MRKLKVLVLFDTDNDPPADQDYENDIRKTDEVEFEVARFLRRRGHDVRCFGFRNDLGPLVRCLMTAQVDVVFNLIERFADDGSLDAAVTGLLDLVGLPYTGASPAGLMMARDKAKTKALLGSLGIPVPGYQVFARSEAIGWCHLKFPLIVKPVDEDASLGVARGSVVRNHNALARRVAWIHEKFSTDAIVEEFIVGREIYVTVIGDKQPLAMPAIEMVFSKRFAPSERFATFRVKWDLKYRQKYGIHNWLARNLSATTRAQLGDIAARSFKALGLRDYGRVDFRLAKDGTPYVLEANPNPYLAYGEDVGNSANAGGVPYGELLERILEFAIQRGVRKK